MDRDRILHAIDHPRTDPPRPVSPAFTAAVLARVRSAPVDEARPDIEGGSAWWIAAVVAIAACALVPVDAWSIEGPDDALLTELLVLAGVALVAGLAIATGVARRAQRAGA